MPLENDNLNRLAAMMKLNGKQCRECGSKDLRVTWIATTTFVDPYDKAEVECYNCGACLDLYGDGVLV